MHVTYLPPYCFASGSVLLGICSIASEKEGLGIRNHSPVLLGSDLEVWILSYVHPRLSRTRMLSHVSECLPMFIQLYVSTLTKNSLMHFKLNVYNKKRTVGTLWVNSNIVILTLDSYWNACFVSSIEGLQPIFPLFLKNNLDDK